MNGPTVEPFVVPTVDPTKPQFSNHFAACPKSVAGDQGFLNWANTLFAMGSTSAPPGQTLAVPTTASLAPSSIVHGTPGAAITITGTGFNKGVVAVANAADQVANFVSATTLIPFIPASLLAAAGTVSITVRNPDGQSSTPALSLTVT